MLSFHLLVATGAAALLVITPAFGQAPARVRGTITAIDDGIITVRERDGRILTLKTGPYITSAVDQPRDSCRLTRQREKYPSGSSR